MKLKIIAGIFILGLLFCATHKTSDIIETFDTTQDCPNLLIQVDNKLKLLNKNKALVPGVNPIYFNNLEEYIEFVEWQQAKGMKCPILYFQQTYTTQGDKKYRLLPDPVEKNAGLPTNPPKAQKRQLYDAGRDDPPYNRNQYAGSDPQDQNIGVYTPLDKMFHSSNKKSDNAMDTNWKGVKGTRLSISKGNYDADFRKDYTKNNQFKINDIKTKSGSKKETEKQFQQDERKLEISRKIQDRQLGFK